MYNLDDKDLDRLSRNAAENYQVPGVPSWEALQRTLDKELPLKKERKRRGLFFFFLLAGLLVAGSLYWYKEQKNIPSKVALAPGENKNTVPAYTATPSTKDNTVTPVPVPNKNIVLAAPSKKPLESPKNHDTYTSSVSSSVKIKNNPARLTDQLNNKNSYQPEKTFNKPGRQTPVTAAVSANKGRPGLLFSKNPTASSGKRDKLKNSKPVTDYSADITTKEAVTKTATTTDETKDDYGVTGKTAGIPAGPQAANKDDLKTVAATTPPAAKPVAEPEKKEIVNSPDKKKTKTKRERAIMATLTAGLDLSTVKFTYSDKTGYNIGVLGGYQFSKHWSVYTGLIYTKKNYKLEGSDYYPPEHYWTTYVNLETVEGYCRMWELPLLGRYTFNSKSNNKFFVSTGLSSYFMKQQHYNYNYKTTLGVPGTSAWSNDSSFNHIFSILHLSAGFEKQFGKHLNWQIEPYAKIPLGGVGFGNIKLSSFGINFSVQYRQPLKH
jgi:Outer membrane protein beta-barrel domain